MKKTLATLLALIMALVMLPNIALAETTDPTKNGNVWRSVTPNNIQNLLDGQYGSIDGTTIELSAGTYSKLELGRATKYAGSNTEYCVGGFDSSAQNYQKFNDVSAFTAHKNQSTWTAPPYYIRNMSNVTFKANGVVSIAGINMTSGHIYGQTGAPIYDYVLDKRTADTNNSYYLAQKVSNITFEGITFTSGCNIATSSEETEISGFTFSNCAFEIGNTASGNYALRYYNEINNEKVSNLVVEDCIFKTCYQGIYTHKIKGVTVKKSIFDTTGHNAIAIQTGGNVSSDHGSVTIEENYFMNIGDRVFRFGDVGSGTVIKINNNVMINSGDGDGEMIKATTVVRGVGVDLEHNYWGKKVAGQNEAVVGFAKPKTTGVIAGTFPVKNEDPDYCAAGYTTEKAEREGYWTVVLKQEVKTNTEEKAEAGGTEGTVSDAVAENKKTEAKTVAESVKNTEENNALTTAVNKVEVKKDTKVTTAAIQALVADGQVKVTEDNEVVAAENESANVAITLIKEPYLDVTVEKMETTDSNKVLTMEITQKYNLKAQATVKTNNGSETGEPVTVSTGNKLEVKEETTLTVKLPDGFVNNTDNTVYVQHKGYVYTAEVRVGTGTDDSGKYYATFVNPHGFSEFVFTVTDPTTMTGSDGTGYTTLQAAVDAAANGATITIKKGATDLTATMTNGGTRTITIKNETESAITVTIDNNKKEIAKGGSATFTYTAPVPTSYPLPSITPYSGGSSSGGNTYSWYFNPTPTPTPVPVIVAPAVALPKTGDMTIWQSILSFFGLI